MTRQRPPSQLIGRGGTSGHTLGRLNRESRRRAGRDEWLRQQLLARLDQQGGDILEAGLDMGRIQAKQEDNYSKIEAGRGQGAGRRRQGADCALLPLLARTKQMRGNFLEAQLDIGKIEAKQEGDYRKIEVGRGQGAGQRRQGTECCCWQGQADALQLP